MTYRNEQTCIKMLKVSLSCCAMNENGCCSTVCLLGMIMGVGICIPIFVHTVGF